MTTKTRQKQIDAFLVSFDETEYYKIYPEHEGKIAKVYGVYLFDRNEITHCCEMTPSYFLTHLYDTVCLTPEADDTLTDEEKSRIYEEYENEGGEDIYVHCHTIDNMIRSRQKDRVYHYGKTGVKLSDSSYKDQWEGIREWATCNPPL